MRSTCFGMSAATFIMLFQGAAALAENLLDGVSEDNFGTQWEFITDGVMGGVSSGQVRLETEGKSTFAVMTGSVSTANRGGFIQVRRLLDQKVPETAEGIRLVVRGNGEEYYVHLRTRGMLVPWQYFQAAFPSSNNWTEIKLPWSSFKASGQLMRQTPVVTSVTSVGIVAYGRDHKADIQVKEIRLY